MKCKWYAEFEGVCTNGSCPYRGDVCPTSEHPEVCKYHNQPEKKLSVGEIVEGLRTCSKGTLCHGCPAQSLSAVDCAKALKEQAAVMLEKLAAEKEPKNRVLTLEELKAYCEGGADAAPLWYDEKERNVSRWMVIDLPELAFGSTAMVKRLVNSQFFEPTYGEKWRCWLRKPTEAERREMPWEGDSRE